MRRHVGGHANGDPGRPVDEEIRYPSRKHDRLRLGAVVVRAERDRALIDLTQHLVGDPRETAFRIAHGRGTVAVERAEISRAVDQRIPERERLRHPHERFVESGIAVRVIAPHDIADHLRALAVLDVGSQVLLPHGVEDSALNRLQPVAHVGQRARRDDRERVCQVAALRGLVQRYPLGRAPGGWRGRCGGLRFRNV